MATTTDIKTTYTSGYNNIDALLDEGPDWNYLTGNPANTLYYTFSVASGNEVINGQPVTGQEAFSWNQQHYTRQAIGYIAQVTGINFVETSSGEAAQVHFANFDIASYDTVGLCSWNSTYRSYTTGELVSYDADAYIYLDNREHAGQSANLAPGGSGYETLLHELGHMLGLKHPHEDTILLPAAQDNTAYTLMSYNDAPGTAPYTAYNSIDLAALAWIYGGDGLGGERGIHSAGGRYLIGSITGETLQGTSLNDKLRGEQGDDMIYGGEGTDTAIFGGSRASYVFNDLGGDLLLAQGLDGTDTLSSIELFEFSDGTVSRSQIVDTTPPAKPSATVATNANGYVSGNMPVVFGVAEANATIKVYNGTTQLASGKADANGFFNVPVTSLANGSYTLSATATDAAGNASAATSLAFKVDATPPAVPSAAIQLDGTGSATSNQPVFSGSGEAGTTISLINSNNDVIGKTKVGADGNWSIKVNPLANASYSITVRASDDADNAASANGNLNFTVNSALNRTGGANNDTLSGDAANNALVGLGGLDTAVYGGTRAGYTVERSTNGFTVSSGADGLDSLLGVERIKFGDASLALDIDGTGGQAYRLYSAVLGRAPDLAGLGFWMSKMDGTVTLRTAGEHFLSSKEFADVYGTNLTTAQFVDRLYQNVLHRPLDDKGYEFWVKAIDERGAERVDVLVAFSESAENKDQVIDTIGNGFEYVPWTGA
jgi:hypothetical protein